MKIDLSKTTPDVQLQMLAAAFSDPKLPHQELNRVLICRASWKADKGLPPSARRSLEKLFQKSELVQAAWDSVYKPKLIEATVTPPGAIRGQETPEQARAILASGEKLHHATKARLEKLVAMEG